MSRGSYEGPAIDGGYQHIAEAPAYQEQAEDIEYATPAEPAGEESVENVPAPDDGPPDVEGQSTLEDWGWSP